jgi:hypothetical protein
VLVVHAGGQALEQEHMGAGEGAGTRERVALVCRRGWSSSAGRRT